MTQVFAFGNYRSYLAEFYRYEKARSPAFSYRSFALKAGLTSPNYLKLVIDGQRPVTEKNLSGFLRGLKLKGAEAEYFRLLVQLQETKDVRTKADLLEQILRLRQRHSGEPAALAKDRIEILRGWHHWAIREMVLLEDFREDPAWIARRLRRRIAPSDAAESLELLQRLEFLQRKGGRLVQTEPMITTSDDISNLIIRHLHRQFIEIGTWSLFNDAVEDRELSGVTLALSPEQLPALKRKLKEFRRELNREFSAPANKAGAAEIYHFESLFFPLTRKVSREAGHDAS